MRSRELFASEPLAQLLHSVVARAGVDPSLLSVIAGFAFAVLYLRLAQRVRGTMRGDWLVAGGTYLATSLHLVFFRGFVESAPLALPMILVFVGAALKYVKTTRTRDLFVTSAVGTIAALVHGSAWFLMPAWWIALSVHTGSPWDWTSAFKRVALALATHGAVIGVFFVLMSALEYRLSAGNAFGGGDGQMFVPLFHVTGFARATMLEANHWLRVANIALAAAPLFFVGGLTAFRAARATVSGQLLSLFAFAYLCFISLWNFDLGFPGDFDLMFSMSPLLGLWTCFVTWEVRGWWVNVPILVAIGAAWMLVQPFVRGV